MRFSYGFTALPLFDDLQKLAYGCMALPWAARSIDLQPAALISRTGLQVRLNLRSRVPESGSAHTRSREA